MGAGLQCLKNNTFSIAPIISSLNTYQGIAQWLMWLTGIAAFCVAYNEFVAKKRPYIDWEIQLAKNPNLQKGGWMFFALVKNTSAYPAMARVNKTLIRVGDEEYPSEVKSEMIIAPGASRSSAMIGSIYESGIQKIRNKEYTNNRVEIQFEIESKPLGEKKMKYISRANYEINVESDMPTIILISEEMN